MRMSLIAEQLGALGPKLKNLRDGRVVIVLVAIVATLIYFDGRIRQEGFDLQLMADELARRSPT